MLVADLAEAGPPGSPDPGYFLNPNPRNASPAVNPCTSVENATTAKAPNRISSR